MEKCAEKYDRKDCPVFIVATVSSFGRSDYGVISKITPWPYVPPVDAVP